MDKVAHRFWYYVGETDENDCWLWNGYCQKSGHAMLNVNRKPVGAYRISYIIHKGEITDNLHVLHSCDNPRCVNPDHLHLGTHLDNMKEKCERGRSINPPRLTGEKHPKSKLTDEQIQQIKERLKDITKPYGKLKQIANEYNVSVSTISLIYKKKTHTE